MRPLVPLLLLTGCPAEEAEAPDAEAPVPYVFEDEEVVEPALGVADLEASIDAAVGGVLALNAAPIFPAYETAMAGAEEGCPAYYESEGNTYWYDQCTSSGGTSFSGYSFHQVYDAYDAGDGSVYDGDAVYGVAQVTTPEGYTFEAGGSAYDLVVSGTGYLYYYSVLAGSFAWDGPEAEGTWLAEGLAPDLSLIAYTTEYGDLVQVDGGLSGLADQMDAVVFDMITLYDASLGSTCATEPGGVISVRDSDGSWYDVVFDGPTEYGDESDPALCDGCGTAFFRGEEMGAVCADFSGLLAWEGEPW